MKKTFFGFGFGPIQSGLFMHEAVLSGNFERIVVAEIDSQLVSAIRGNNNSFAINIARKDRIETVRHRGIEIYNPKVKEDRLKIVNAIADSDELTTALPSVNFYTSDENGVDALLAEGIKKSDKKKIVYTAENNNRAGEILEEKVSKIAGENISSRAQFLNTVIGKMSQRMDSAELIREMKLETIVPGYSYAFLVEEFNHILISEVTLEGFKRGIGVFVEKKNLLPFEEAKLYGHNAIHALMGYLSALKGYGYISEARNDKEIMSVAKKAFIEESGKSLIRKNNGMDELFTEDDYKAYAEDLLERITNPYLKDAVKRVCRDPYRKLGYEDRLIGTMVICVEYGIKPEIMALGAAACLIYAEPDIEKKDIRDKLYGIWNKKTEISDDITGLVENAFDAIDNWRKGKGKI